MIIDQLENASQYYGLGTRIEMALRYLQETDLQNVGVDRYDIDGDKVYAMVQGYDSKPKAEGFWESHRKYLDVQYVAAGAEPSAEDGAEDGAGRVGPADARACERGSMSTKARLALAKLRRHACMSFGWLARM